MAIRSDGSTIRLDSSHSSSICPFNPLIHEEKHENSRLLLVKNNKPKKLEKPNVLDRKRSPTRSGMQGLYERARADWFVHRGVALRLREWDGPCAFEDARG